MSRTSGTPKPRNAAKTKARILAAAQQAFSEHGYAQAGIRGIAAGADTTSPMLLRYFGSKAGLFEAALIEAMRVGELFEGSRAGFGERLADLFLDTTLDIKAPSLIALSTGHADARDIATRVIGKQVVGPLARWLGPPDARVRALKIIMLAMGFVLFARQFPLVPLHKGGEKKLARWLAQMVQSIVDG
jgi:AcrR family transcriptional regulator